MHTFAHRHSVEPVTLKMPFAPVTNTFPAALPLITQSFEIITGLAPTSYDPGGISTIPDPVMDSQRSTSLIHAAVRRVLA